MRGNWPVYSAQFPLEQGQQSAPGALRLLLVVDGGVRRAPAVSGTGVDLDFRLDAGLFEGFP